jgi:hypothetical protein
MSERRFFDSEALIDALVKSTTEIDLEFDTNLLLKKLRQNDADILNDAILQVLKESELVSDVEHHQTIPPPGQQQGFGLRLRRKIKDGHTEKVTFYRVKESLKTGYLSLVGLAAGLWMNSPSVVIPGTSLLINSWRNFISLKHP